MNLFRLGPLILDDLRRNAKHFTLASIGIIVGIAAFTFFLGLGSGVGNIVLGKIFPLDKLEIVPRNVEVDVGPLRMGLGSDVLDEKVVEQLSAIPHVDRVYPKMKLAVPAVAYGGKALIGNDLRTEIIGDGIDPALVADELSSKYGFRDFEDEQSVANAPRCGDDSDCGEGLYCGPPPLQPEGEYGAGEGRCRHPIPVLASKHLIEMYNGVIRRAHGFPRLNPDFVIGLEWELQLGRSMVQASNRKRVFKHRARLVGFSDKAISLGITLPLPYVRRYNALYGSPEAARQYHSIVVSVDSKDEVAGVAKAVEELGFTVADQGAEQAAMLIAVFMLVFGSVSAVIVGIAAINIMHVFFMLVYERQREIGIMRAVGASRNDIRRIILGEAAVIGLLGGIAGVLLALFAAWAFDGLSASHLPDFPYKPDTYFEFGLPLLGEHCSSPCSFAFWAHIFLHVAPRP